MPLVSALFVGHDVFKLNHALRLYLAKRDLPLFQQADQERPAEVQQLGDLLGAQLMVMRNQARGTPP
jgi:hypothetical protein